MCEWREIEGPFCHHILLPIATLKIVSEFKSFNKTLHLGKTYFLSVGGGVRIVLLTMLSILSLQIIVLEDTKEYISYAPKEETKAQDSQ